MRNFMRWLRIGARRRWALALFGGAAAVWLLLYLFPARGRGADLELLVLGGDGKFSESISIPNHWAITSGLPSGAGVRVPLILAIRNTGKKKSPPARLELTLPTRYRIIGNNGHSLPAEYMPGTPMARYQIHVPAIRASSGTVAGYLPVLDTIWLEPIIPPYYCIALSDSVPDFVPAPPAPVEAIAQVRIFYSFTAEELKRRQTGLLAVQLDPALLKQETQPAPPVFPTQYSRPKAPRPPLSALEYVGSRRARCGDPQDPMEILSTLWETPAGGRLFVLDYGGAPRKYLFDLDRDSIIELEMWDGTGSGNFDARRQARLPIPAFLMPPAAAPAYDPAALASKTPEQLLALDRYAQVLESPYRFRTLPPPSKPQTNRYRPGSIASADTASNSRSGYTIRYWSDPAGESALPAAVPMPTTGANARQGASPATSQPAVPGGRVSPQATPQPSGPPMLGRPLTPEPSTVRPQRPVPDHDATTRPGNAPVAPARPAPDRPTPDGPPADQPAADKPATDKPATDKPAVDKPAQTPPRPTRREPKVLGKPLDSIPPRPPPD